MKTTKRVIAVVLAVLMIAMVASVAVTAATTKQYSFTLKCTKPGYEFTVYPLATQLTFTTSARLQQVSDRVFLTSSHQAQQQPQRHTHSPQASTL